MQHMHIEQCQYVFDMQSSVSILSDWLNFPRFLRNIKALRSTYESYEALWHQTVAQGGCLPVGHAFGVKNLQVISYRIGLYSRPFSVTRISTHIQAVTESSCKQKPRGCNMFGMQLVDLPCARVR